jgi:hypothetical protein
MNQSDIDFLTQNNISVWMYGKEVEMVLKYLKPQSTVFEWGSGGSTLLFSRYVKKYVSVEHNLDWYFEIKNIIDKNKISNIDNYLVDIPKGVPTKKDKFYDKWQKEINILSKENLNTIPKLDYCLYPKKKYTWGEYIDIIDEISPNTKYDFVFIDGRARADCAFKALEYIHDDSIVFIHDFFGRDRYHVVLEYYDMIDSVKETQDNTGLSIVALRRKNETN